jgi:hypothetical protein
MYAWALLTQSADIGTSEQGYSSHFTGYRQDLNAYSAAGPGFPAGTHLASYTSQRPPVMVDNSRQGVRNPTATLNNYDSFEQSISSPPLSAEILYPAPKRLQDRVDLPASYVTAGAPGLSSLSSRMAQENEQPTFVERSASDQGNTSNRAAHARGPRSNTSGNNGQLAARLGVGTGERSQPLASRLLSEPQPRPNYQNREPLPRPGGGLMARMVGDKPGE